MTQASSSVDARFPDTDRPFDEVIEEFRGECRMLLGIDDIRVLFPHADGFTDADGRVVVAASESTHPVATAASRRQPVYASWPGEGYGVACPLDGEGIHPDAVIWFAMADRHEDRAESLFLLEASVERLRRHLKRAVQAWAAHRREAALLAADEAVQRFLTETSLHRALRLGITELAALAEGTDVCAFECADGNEPTCLAYVRSGNANRAREVAIERIVGDLCDTRVPVFVSDTSASERFGWCREEGIGRFIAEPIQAYDRFYGFIIVTDFRAGAPGLDGQPVPGTKEVIRVLASATALAMFQGQLESARLELDGDLQDAVRAVDRHERVVARFDLCRDATIALHDALDELAGVPDADPDVASRVERALDVLGELDRLVSEPPPRLRLTNLNAILDATAEEVRSDMGREPASISLRLQGDLPELLLDEAKIRRVLATVIEHGLSGTEERQAIVTTRTQKGEVVVEIRIPDRIAPGGILDGLFMPFVESEGGGSNLSLADQIVREHGGQLRAKSMPGEGLLYWLSLPIDENEERRSKRADRRAGRDRRSRKAA